MQNISTVASAGSYFDYTSASRGGNRDGSANGTAPLSIADLFGLSTASKYKNKAHEGADFIPPNVKQQIELWEKELNCIKVRPSVMVVLNSLDTAKSFVQFCLNNNI